MKIILIAAISANGQIAQSEAQKSTDWTSKEDLHFFTTKTKEAGVLIMGRKTFDTIGRPLKGRRMIVMTNRGLEPAFAKASAGRGKEGRERLEGKEVNEGTVEFTNESPQEILDRLQSEGCEQVVIAGGASIYSQFLKENLVTDLYLTIEPVLFGQGVPLASGFDRINLKLVEMQKLNEQTILLHYKIN